MHWVWRVAIAVVVAGIYGGLSVAAFEDMHEAIAEFVVGLLGMGGTWGGWQSGVAVALAWFMPVTLLAFTVYGLLTRFLGPRSTHNGETRCRKCRYILRGISEPRCPECGERI
jgi:hypothetical protein